MLSSIALRETQQLGDGGKRDVLLLARAAQLHFHIALGQTTLADDHLQRPADKVGVRELHASALLAVVDDHVEAEIGDLAREFLSRGLHLIVANRKRDNAHVSRRDVERPLDAVLVVVLLDDGGHRTGDAHAVAAHDERVLHTILVVEGGTHGLGVTGTQLEHLGNLDAAGTRKRQTAVGAAVTGLDDAQVGPFVHREIAALFGAHVMVVVLVRADDPMADALQAAGSDDARALGQADRAHRALVQAEGFHFLVGEQLKPGNGALGFNLVELVVTGDEHHDELALGVLAGERLHRGAFGDAKELRELLDRADARGMDLLKLGGLVLRRAGQALASLGVRSITAGAVHKLGLARRGKRHELGRHLAADLTAIGLDGAVIQAAAIADGAVGAAHVVVGFLQ